MIVYIEQSGGSITPPGQVPGIGPRSRWFPAGITGSCYFEDAIQNRLFGQNKISWMKDFKIQDQA